MMLVERSSELDRLSALLQQSQGSVVLIRGEAGIGKSALIESWMDRHEKECDFVVGRCDDLSTPQPLGPFWDMADAAPEFHDGLGRGDRRAVARTALDLLERSLRRTVIVIEDTQWADEATMDAIKTIGRRIRNGRGLLILTYRDGEVDDRHPLRGVLGDLPPSHVERIRLQGLTEDGVRRLLAGHPSDPTEIWGVTGGNPLLVTALSTADAGDGSSLPDLIAARLNRLDEETRTILQLLSVIPGDIGVGLVERLISGAERFLGEAHRRGFLILAGTRLRFRHELIRREIEASLIPTERMAMNHRVLEALDDDADPAIVAHHAWQAGDVESLIATAPLAARNAMALGAHRQAVAHFRVLADHVDAIPSRRRAAILEDWAQEEFYAHQLAVARSLIDEAIREYRAARDPAGEARSLARAATYHSFSGEREAAVAAVEEAEDALGDDPGARERAEVIETRAYLRMLAGDVAGSGRLVDEALAVAGEAADDRLLVRALNGRGTMTNVACYPDGLAMITEARDRAAAAGLWYEEARALLNGAWAGIEHRDLSTASSMLDEALSLASRTDLGAAEHYGLALRVRLLDLTGDWDEAERLAEGLRSEGGIAAITVLPVMACIAARRGSSDAASIASEAWSVATPEEFQRLGPAAAALAETSWITGSTVDVAGVVDVLRMGLGIGFRWQTGVIAFWLWRLGALGEMPEGLAEPYAALISGDTKGAVALWETIESPYECALAKSMGTAAERLEAIELLETLGASAVAARVRRDLRSQGVDVPRGRARSTRRNPAGLTARQAEVLELVAEGLANGEIADRLFLSQRTVEHHISAILGKLGAADRTEAALWMQEAGPEANDGENDIHT